MIEPDYFAHKRAELGFERIDQLAVVQAWCDARYAGLVRVKRLHQGTLRIVTTSAGVAGELRMRQVELQGVVGDPQVRVAISIGTLD